MISLLSLISRAALSERSDECDNCGNFLSGDVRVPASKAIILYVCGSSGGFLDSNALAASSVRAHLDMDRRRAYGIVGVDELQLAVSERSDESSAESEGGIVSMRGRSISMRWGSSEMVRLSDGGSWLIELGNLREGTTSDIVLVGGVNGTRNVHGYPSLVLLVVAPPLFSYSSSSQNPSHFPVLRSALDDVSRELTSNKSLRSFRQHSSVHQPN
jgi:hypothetical protein